MKTIEFETADQVSAPPDTTTLFAGNIADYDFMWAVQTSAAQLAAFLQAPQTWVASLASLSDWLDVDGEPAGAPSLNAVFTLRMDSPPPTLLPDSGDVIIQGISGTGFVTVKPSASASNSLLQSTHLLRLANRALSAGPLIPKTAMLDTLTEVQQDYWSSFALNSDGSTKELDIFSDLTGGIFFGHVPVWTASDGIDKATAVAAFLVAAFEDHNGYMGALDNCLQVVNQRNASGLTQPGTTISFSSSVASAITITYLSDGPSDNDACDVLDGTMTSLTPTVTGSSVKDYSGQS